MGRVQIDKFTSGRLEEGVIPRRRLGRRRKQASRFVRVEVNPGSDAQSTRSNASRIFSFRGSSSLAPPSVR